MPNFSLIDLIVIVLVILGTFIGYKKGLIKGIITTFGVIICLIIAWFLKNSLSEFMYTKLPFFSFNGDMSLFNIIIYELIAFLIISIILLLVLKFIVMFTGLIDKILSISKSIKTLSNILGAILGFFETYVFVFIILFILHSVSPLTNQIDQGFITNYMINKTPILASAIEKEDKSLNEITDLGKKYQKGTDEYNYHLFEILVKYDVIKYDTAKKLVDDNKVKINGASEIIDKYKK